MRDKKLKTQSLCSDLYDDLKKKQSAMDKKREEFEKEWENTYRPNNQKEPPRLP
jgi:hypothetical protein